MGDHELEQLRRSIAMLPPGHSSAGPLTKDAATAVVQEAIRARREEARYRKVVVQLRAALNTLSEPAPS
ncbi:MAG: hypothetical protein M0Z30_13290 [Actinomycetota bacterium]|nr:hypothetical protein [Actinomycetota bacterium]